MWQPRSQDFSLEGKVLGTRLAIWMKELLGYSVDDVAATLFISQERWSAICRNTGEVKWEKLGRPLNSFAIHPHYGSCP